VEEGFWGMKVGGTGNSLRRRGTGVLRVCFTEERVMVDERKREREMDERSSASVCASGCPEKRESRGI
jgi:hypothetical protein